MEAKAATKAVTARLIESWEPEVLEEELVGEERWQPVRSKYGIFSVSDAIPPIAFRMLGDCISCCSKIRLP